MKGRSVKLKEAHRNDGVASFCSIVYDLQGHHLVTSSSSLAEVSIHNLLEPSEPSNVLRHHKDGVTALALNSNSTCLASGSVDHSVKLYKFPGGEFQSNVTRFTLPIRCLAFNKSGTLLAAAGDDEGIKLIAAIDGSISRVLKGHKGPITGIAFDPANDYLVSVDGTGTVIFWEVSSGNPIHTLKSVAPNFGVDTSITNVLSWSPDGETVAVPGLKNDVVMYDRDTAEKLFSLRGDHEQPICFLCWSPNGKYMATSGLDRQVLIWDIDQRQDIHRQKFVDRISCLAWNPTGNALAVIDVMGNFGVWESPVPARMRLPTDGVPCLEANVCNGLLLFDDDNEEHSDSGSFGRESLSESFHLKRKRLRKQALFDEALDGYSDDEVDSSHNIDLYKKSLSKHRESSKSKRENQDLPKLTKPKLQDAFQPGSTPPQAGKRHFLCYNMLGSITSIQNDGYCHIEIDFHDTGRGPRVSSMTDHFGFTMASLNENGSVFANPRKGEKSMSTLMYRPFTSWANNSEWSMRFEEEEVKVVALGDGWVAAVTDLNFLRIFSVAGLQRHIISLDGPVLTAAGFKDELAIVTFASDCFLSGDAVLEFKMFNIANGTQPVGGRLSLTPGSCLSWFGFSEEGYLSSYDSKGVLRVFTNLYGGNWLPLFSKERKSEMESYWVVGLNSSKLFCVVCNSPDLYPLVVPKPVLTLMNLSFPLASSDLGPNDLENELMMNKLYLSQTQEKIEETVAAGLDTTSLDDEAFNTEAALDRCILRLIASCCNGDKLVRATELAQLLSLEKSLKGAIKLVTALKLPILAERFNGMLEERLLNDSNGVIFNTAEAKGATSCTTINRASEPVTPVLVPKLPSPDFRKQGKAEENVNIRKEGENPKAATGSRDEGQPSNSQQPTNPFSGTKDYIDKPPKKSKVVTGEIRSTRNYGDSSVKESPDQIQRPKNPFVKVNTNPEKSSLFDSIKKMKVDKVKENGAKK
ncbi:protein ENHANCER OF LHP1 1-like [Aristolochia californica]|uniref:protein ENHANCER OF LHP1 1-like n=1 Tax=Aristolochia californica TaxID=171875 RepID=UPI0035DA1069